ncbi:MAG: hypothetical protein NXI01_03355 [Gammaproteobacteria bacterium]|nr:hypothetical protein [Gammaproteobacteria bacterium]
MKKISAKMNVYGAQTADVSFVDEMVHLEGNNNTPWLKSGNFEEQKKHSSVLLDRSICIADIDVHLFPTSLTSKSQPLDENEYRVVFVTTEMAQGLLAQEDLITHYFGPKPTSHRGLILHVSDSSGVDEIRQRVECLKTDNPYLALDVSTTSEELKSIFNKQIKSNYFHVFIAGFCKNIADKFGEEMTTHIRPVIDQLYRGWGSGHPDFNAFEQDCMAQFQQHLPMRGMPKAREILSALLVSLALGFLVCWVTPFMVYLSVCLTLKMGVLSGTIAFNSAMLAKVAGSVGLTAGVLSATGWFSKTHSDLAKLEVGDVITQLKSPSLCGLTASGQ